MTTSVTYLTVDLGYSIASSYTDQRADQTVVARWIADMDALITDLSTVEAQSTGRDYVIKIGVKLTYVGYEQLRLANGASNVSGVIQAQFAQLTEQWTQFYSLCKNLKRRSKTFGGDLTSLNMSELAGW